MLPWQTLSLVGVAGGGGGSKRGQRRKLLLRPAEAAA